MANESLISRIFLFHLRARTARAIVPKNLLLAFLRHTFHFKKLIDRLGEIRVAVRIVGGENDLVVADQIDNHR